MSYDAFLDREHERWTNSQEEPPMEECEECEGTGEIEDEGVCPVCEGLGEVEVEYDEPDFDEPEPEIDEDACFGGVDW